MDEQPIPGFPLHHLPGKVVNIPLVFNALRVLPAGSGEFPLYLTKSVWYNWPEVVSFLGHQIAHKNELQFFAAGLFRWAEGLGGELVVPSCNIRKGQERLFRARIGPPKIPVGRS